jgi:hypothetical protein
LEQRLDVYCSYRDTSKTITGFTDVAASVYRPAIYTS